MYRSPYPEKGARMSADIIVILLGVAVIALTLVALRTFFRREKTEHPSIREVELPAEDEEESKQDTE